MRNLLLASTSVMLVCCGEPRLVHIPVLDPPPTAEPGQPPPPNGLPHLIVKSHPDPPDGPAPLDVFWNLCNSFDPDDDLLTFTFNFDQDGRQYMGNGCDGNFRYHRGVHQTELCVWDRDPRHPFICQTIEVNAR